MHNSKVRVFHIVKWYPNPEDDLAGIFIPRHIASIDDRFENYVFYARKFNNARHFIKKKSDYGNFTELHAFYPDRYTGINFVDRAIKFYFYYKTLHGLISQCAQDHGTPSIIHAHVMTRTVAIGFLFKKKWAIPLILTEHWSVYQMKNWRKRNAIWKLVTKLLLNKTDIVLPVSKKLAEDMQQIGLCRPTKVVYNVVDTDRFRLKNDHISAKMRFIHVSDFTEFTKNVKGILNAVKKLSEIREDFEMILVGYGSYEKEIRDYAESLNILHGIVKFRGKLLGDDLVREIQTSDAFILFSRYENLPCVLIEAMACGVPVISSDVGGISEIVKDFNGVLIKSEDEGALATEMLNFLENKKKYNPAEIRQFAVNNFSNAVVGNQISEIYRQYL